MPSRIVQQIAPGTPIQVTRDSTSWYRQFGGQLLVPPMQVLHANVLELNKFVEAIKSFQYLPENGYDWANLTLYEIRTAGEIRDLHSELLKHGEVAVDIETRRVEWEDNRMLAIGFAYNDSRCAAIRWATLDSEALDALQHLLADPDLTFIWQNGKFDVTRLKYLADVDARVDEDTMIQHYVQINERRGSHGLKDLGALYLGAPKWDDELDRLKARYAKDNKCTLDQFMYDMIPMEILIPYMQRDCIATLRLNKLFKQLAADGTEWIYRKLIEASNGLARVELAGMKIDFDYLEDLEQILDTEIEVASAELDTVAQRTWDVREYVRDTGAKSWPKFFNMKSPAQLKWMIEKALGHKIPNTKAETLDALLEEHDDVEFLRALQKLRKLNKQMDTYICGIRERVCRDMRVRGTFNIHGTETGRLSSSNPNMQNIPRKGPIKGLFIAESGNTLVEMDYSQAEIRVLAYLSGDEYLTQIYQDDRDLHGEMATLIFGKGWTDEQRNLCKTIIFGSMYGRGPSSVASQLRCSMSEARGLIEKVFSFMPAAKEWIQNRRAMATRGEDCITVFGRRRHFVLTSREALNHIQNEYINTPIQATASDLTLFSAMEFMKKLPSTTHIISLVHDAIYLEVEQSIVEQVIAEGLRVMAQTPQLLLPDCKVPFKAEAKYGTRWSEMRKCE